MYSEKGIQTGHRYLASVLLTHQSYFTIKDHRWLMANFNIAYRRVRRIEGGYAYTSNDRGGETYKGVSRKANPQWTGWSRIDSHKQTFEGQSIPNGAVLVDDQLDREVVELFRSSYWNKVKGDRIHNQRVAEVVFDTYVHSGIHGLKAVQRALNDIGSTLSVDGGIGVNTLKVLNSLDAAQVCQSIKARRSLALEALIRKDPTQQKFKKGWDRRLQEFASVNG